MTAADDKAPLTANESKLAARAMRRNLSAMLTHYAFFGSLALRMPLTPRAVEDIACDGEQVFYNPRWVLAATSEEVTEGIARSCLACALKHHTRRGDRDPAAWQQASNQVTAPILRDSGFRVETIFGRDLTVEQAYIEPEKSDDGGGGAGGGDSPGKVMDHPRLQGDDDGRDVESIRRELEAEVDRNMVQSSQVSNALKSNGGGEGNSTDAIDELIRSMGRAKTPFNEFLRQFVIQNGNRDYTWSRPNRRHIDGGLYLPSIRSESMPAVIFLVDVSGSLPTDKLAIVWRELRDTCITIQPESVIVMQHDTVVHKVDTYDCDELPLELDAKGRGGTSFIDCYKRVEELPPAACIIHFTDLECSRFPKHPPSAPVLWARIDGGGTKPPFGTIIDVVE